MTMGPDPMTRTDLIDGSLGISPSVSHAPSAFTKMSPRESARGHHLGVGVGEAPHVPEGVEAGERLWCGGAHERALVGIESGAAGQVRPGPGPLDEARRGRVGAGG